MTSKTKTILKVLAAIGGATYMAYLHIRLDEVSNVIGEATDALASKTDVDIEESLVDRAVQTAVNREARRVGASIANDLRYEIRMQVERSVNSSASDIKNSVSTEIANRIKNINISDMEREVVSKAKEAVAEKFDRKLDGLLDEFNSNLNNVQKIYSSIAKSISKD